MVRELFSKQNIDFAERAREIAEEHMRPIAAKHDVDQTYPWAAQQAIREAGLFGRVDPQGVRRRTAAACSTCAS